MSQPSILTKALFSVFRIETEKTKATCFVFRYEDKRRYVDFFVTNRHVVEETSNSTIICPEDINGKRNPKQKIILNLTDSPRWWNFHPDSEVDIAVSPMKPFEDKLFQEQGSRIFYVSLGEDLIIDNAEQDKMDVFEDVCFIGCPTGLWDSLYLLPLIRRGTTASPYFVNFEGKRKFIIDGHIFEGSSGSPVFLYARDAIVGQAHSTRFAFLGVLSNVMYQIVKAKEQLDEDLNEEIRNSLCFRDPIGLGVVWKPETVIETIEKYLAGISNK